MKAVLLMAYGGPDSLENIEPYLLDVRGGRPAPPELAREIRDRYALIGGRSPLLERTVEQAEALERYLRERVGEFRAYVGMRHWHPYIRETFERIVADGVTNLVAIAMAPQYARMSVGAYIRKVEQAQAALGSRVPVRYVKSWHDHPLFLAAVAEKVHQALSGYPEGRDVTVVFTAHSLPQRIVQEGDPYHREFLASAEGVARLLGLSEWQWAYQSQGSTQDKWLGPDVGAVLDKLHESGRRDVLIVPIGFVCDHVEVLYDIDVCYRDYAARKGMRLSRTESLNASPKFIEALSSIVQQSVKD